jgi:2-hydroxychromene-2-carboxylate isomerase
MAAVEFFWDPVCPWAWITSRWVTEVAGQRDLDVDWRFICLRILNRDKDYGQEFPDGYIAGHGTGQKLLRVAAAVREAQGRGAMAALYTRWGTDIHVAGRRAEIVGRWEAGFPDYLAEVGVPPDLAAAANDERWDEVLEAETEEALSRVGRDVGTPIITFGGDTPASFFGPVISRIPRGEAALRLWDAIEEVARTPGMSELKRSIRERPQTS